MTNYSQNQQLIQFVDEANKAGGTYHRLDLGDGLVIQGDYDITKYIHHYKLPENLKGKTVLDIGTASGYFAIECARRGGRVTAIDIWDTPLFLPLVEIMNLDIRYVKKSIYELDTDFGQFDLVVCGSLLLHLPDQFGAIQKIRSVCTGQAIVATACPPDDSITNVRPVCEFIGEKAPDGDYWMYWTLSASALTRMFLAAGFSRVENQEHFILSTQAGREQQFATPHVVMTGFV